MPAIPLIAIMLILITEETNSVSESQDGGSVTSQPTETEPGGPRSFLEWDRITGDWAGLRPKLEDGGLTIDLGLTTIYQHNAHGGLRTRNAHEVSGSYDLELTLDTQAAKLWKGGKFYAYASGSWSDGVSPFVGDRFGLNWDAGGNREIDVWELWYEHAFWDGKARVRFGKIDLHIDFDTNAFANDSSSQFLNYGLVNSVNIPFPSNGHGALAFLTPCDGFYVGGAVADAQADNYKGGFSTAYHDEDYFFSIFEAGLTPTWMAGWGELPGSYRIGLWYDPQPKEVFRSDLGERRRIPTRTDDAGFYVSADQVILRERPDVEGDAQGLGLFARYGRARGDVNPIEDFWSVGGQYTGLIPTRDADVLGFGVAQGILTRELSRVGGRPHQETALELFYNVEISPAIRLSPDFQWILRPGGENGRDAFVAGLRLQVAF